jgi:energy-coupling factor transporter transmembrane protein EcfT
MIAMPLLEDALERSLDLAAAMESRGFGQKVRRTRYRADRWQSQDHLIFLPALAALVLIAVIDSNLLLTLFVFLLATSSAMLKNNPEGAIR